MDKEKEKTAIHCALWLQSCSRTHALWCDCGLWTSHIKGWHPTDADPGVGGATARDGAGSEVRVNEYGDLVDIRKDLGDDG
nr:ORF2 [Torque teno felis virus]